MREGKIGLVGVYPFPTTSSKGPTSITLKQPYLSNDYSGDSDLLSSIVPTLSLSPDEQIKELAADALSIQWASSLLQDVYDFIAFYHQSRNTTCPVKIPQFRFVKSGLAVTNVAGVAAEQKEVYLAEELIRPEDGPWRKYINNNTSYPRHFGDNENRRCADFLAFCQHVQYWRTGCQAFTSDFQGESCFQSVPCVADNTARGRYAPDRPTNHHTSVRDSL
jgi:hypothetical protein